MALPMFLSERGPDETLRFIHANSALLEITGCPASMFDHIEVSAAFPARLADRLEEKYRAGFESASPITFEEVILLGGQDTFWQTTLSKPAGFDDTILLGVALPNTEQKQKAFAAAADLAEMAARFDELKLFSTMAAHDARSPLATVSSLIDLIREDFVDCGDGKGELLDICQQTVTEALAQITGTLQRAQNLTLGGASEAVVELETLTGDIAAMIDPEARIDISLPSGQVIADEVLLQMALRNLMANAARYCDNRIVVMLAETASEGMITLFVADDGLGLPAGADIADLTASTREKNNGHGFGLAAISQLAASRGGRLDSAPLGIGPDLPGAVFRLTLPGRRVVQGAANNGPAFAAE